MTRLSQLLHLDDGEFPELRAAIESKPLPAPAAPKPLGWGPAMLSYLRALDVAATPTTAPLPQTDWSARIARDWRHLDARWDNLSGAITRVYDGLPDAAVNETRGRFAQLLSELTELTAVQLPDWRQSLRIHAEAELALYGTESGAGR